MPAVLAHGDGDSGTIREIAPAANETHHLEVKPESMEGYRIPYMEITVDIIDPQTNKTTTVELMPMFGGNFHYGANVALEPKQYRMKFHLDAPMMMRTHVREGQWRESVEQEFSFDAAASFEESMKLGTKETDDMKISFEAEHAETMFMPEGMEDEHMADHDDMMTMMQDTAESQQTGVPPTIAILVAALSFAAGGFLGRYFLKPRA